MSLVSDRRYLRLMFTRQPAIFSEREWIVLQDLRRAAFASLALLSLPLALTLANPASRIQGGDGGGFDWMPGSFLVMGVMLFGSIMAIQMAARRLTSPGARALAVLLILAVVGAIWVELAVDGVSGLLFDLAFAQSSSPFPIGIRLA
ncbi:MAG: hypothetical protein AAF559_13340 [Pseudomonadota bacterium]